MKCLNNLCKPRGWRFVGYGGKICRGNGARLGQERDLEKSALLPLVWLIVIANVSSCYLHTHREV